MVTPIKSPIDPQSYRVIKLQNGLKALLITSCSYQANESTQKKCTSKKSESENCTNRLKQFNRENVVGDDDEESTEGSSLLESVAEISNTPMNPLAEEKKAVAILDNGETPGLTEKQKQQICKEARNFDMMACVSLCVGAGYFDDPPDLPGAAHLLEHLLLMGCEKYPESTFFDEFLSFTGGTPWNGNTDGCRTVYYFDTSVDYLGEALDILASHVKAPLLSPELISIERENVDGEFRKAVTGHQFRFNHFLQQLATPGHPYHAFSWGNAESLSRNKTDFQVSEALKTFFHRYYSADIMYLTVQAALTLSELEAKVVQSLSDVPVRPVKRVCFMEIPRPFSNCKFSKLYKVQAVTDVRMLIVTWQLPPEAWKDYNVKSLDYIAYVLLNENVNGLPYFLRKEGLITDVSVNPTETNMERSDACTIFGIHFTLTAYGLDNYKDVLRALFSYIKLMKIEGPQFRLFAELSKARAMEFHFIRDGDLGVRVKEISEAMRVYKSEDILCGPILMRKYDPELISRMTSYLRPEEANYMLFSKDFESVVTKKEKYFGIEYEDEDFDRLEMRTLRTIDVYSSFDFCLPNPFITTNFCLVEPTFREDIEQLMPIYLPHPKYSVNEQPVHLWFFQDEDPMAPQGVYTIALHSPIGMESPENATILDILALLLQDQFKGCIYSAAHANLEVSIQRIFNGLIFRLAGFNQKLTLLLAELLATFSTLERYITENQFIEARSRIREEFENLMLQPCMLASDTRQVLLIDRMWGVTCQYNVCNHIILSRFREIVADFKNRLHVRAYVAGNINRTGALEVIDLLINHLKFRPVGTFEFPKTRINQMPLGEKCIRIRSYSLEGDTSVIKNIYQVGILDAKTRVISDYLLEIISEPMFNCLRTEKQLSYNPEMIFHDEFGVMQLQIHLITQADKFGPEFVNTEIDNFLEQFFLEEINTLTEQKMNVLRKEMIQSKKIYLESPMESEVVWEKVVTEEVDFDFLLHQINAWKNLKAKDIKDFFKKYLLRPSFVCKHFPNFLQEYRGWHYRKLSIQVVGYSANERKQRRKLNEANDYSKLQHLNVDENDDYFITNIMEFKQTLLSHPGKF